jgi:hypothetical protein
MPLLLIAPAAVFAAAGGGGGHGGAGGGGPGGEQVPLDERGNPLLRDIGTFLKKKIKAAIPDAGEGG